jgi:predicted N-formylglutamate amidohydrolase
VTPASIDSLEGRWAVVVTVEHGGNRVPTEYAELFRGREAMLDSHRGWDPGTRSLGHALSHGLGGRLVESDVTRLLVDLNRSPRNPRVFSELTRSLPRAERSDLLQRYHRPHWDRARAAISAALTDAGRVLHLAVHSFTPVLDGRPRRPDIALLYDPGRDTERSFAARWKDGLTSVSEAVIGRNDPYRGSADGLTTALRHAYPPDRYVGIEVEVNQRHVGSDGAFPAWVSSVLLASLSCVLDLRTTRPEASSG